MQTEVVAPEPGDIWQEIDPRHPRLVRVESINPTTNNARIRAVVRDTGKWIIAPRSRLTVASMNRFNGRRGGYKLHERVGVAL